MDVSVALTTKETSEKLEASWPAPGPLEGASWGCPQGTEHVPAHLCTPFTASQAHVGGWGSEAGVVGDDRGRRVSTGCV